jgi:hypothetical protein
VQLARERVGQLGVDLGEGSVEVIGAQLAHGALLRR